MNKTVLRYMAYALSKGVKKRFSIIDVATEKRLGKKCYWDIPEINGTPQIRHGIHKCLLIFSCGNS